MKRTTAEWVEKAEADYQLARRIARGAVQFHDAVCFHCQQSAEKYMKGLLEEQGLNVPKTHDLERLLTALRPHHPSLRSLHRGLAFLTQFAVHVRYPGDRAKKRQIQPALRWAGRTRQAARQLLNIPSKGRP